ncbi:MAG TPA: DUF6377 domain-containing protein [Puia sp.]
MGRYYYDLANYDYDGAHHSVLYDEKANHYMDSALTFYSRRSFEYAYYSGLLEFKKNNTEKAARFLDSLLNSGSLTDHQLALTASTLSGIYGQKGAAKEAIDLLVIAAIADVTSSTKETFAIFNLADLLYKQGDVKHASLCIETAVANAEFYGARQRKVQVSSILSLIEGERINAVETQRRNLFQYAAIVTLLLIALAALIVIIRRQMKKIQKAQQLLTEAHAAQHLINEKLEEANKIKEEYIGYFFSLDSEFFVKLERNPDVTALYTQVIGLRNSSTAIRRGTLASYDNNDVCAFTKTAPGDTVLVMANLRNTAIVYPVPAALQNTTWSDGFDQSAKSLGTSYPLPAYGYTVLRKQ